MAHKAPGKSDREGLTMVHLCDMFPDENSARQWFESPHLGGWPLLPGLRKHPDP